MELWATSGKRELQERLDTHEVMEAIAHIIEYTLDAQLKMKLGDTEITRLLADFGENIHLAKIIGRYVALIEAESIMFEKIRNKRWEE